MYYYGYGNGCYNNCMNPCYPTYATNNCGFGGGAYGSSTGWLAIILVVFLILVLCGFTRSSNL